VLIRELIQQRLDSSLKVFNRDGIQISDSQVKAEYQTIRQYLLDFHAQKHDCVAIKQHKDYRYLLTILACMEIGIPYIPMKYDYPMDRVGQIQEDSKFTILIDDSKMEEILSYQKKANSTLPEVSPDQNMYIIFTSGSTGRPKGVIIQRKALNNFFDFIDKAFTKVTPQDRLLQVTEFTFDISLVDVAFFLTKNVTLHFSNFENNIFKLGFEIETHRISVLNTVPNNLNMFLSELVAERMDYQCLKHLYIGGARFSYGLYQKCLKYLTPEVEIFNFYGPTEATVYCHVKKISYEENQDCFEGNVSIGSTLPEVDAHIVIDNKVAGPGEKGELYIGGIQLMREYINNPEQTNKALVQFEGKTYYRSGDLAFRSEANEFFIVGRADDTIKYRGFRINLLDIDSYVTRIPYVQDSVTISIPNEATENQTIGYIILKEPKTIKELKKDLGALLLDYQIPEKIIFVDKFPVNVSGKVCKNTLKAQYLESLNKVKND
jgi:acyl-coenzyme A synthetase/AMP-(fatty) acid ligase